MNCWKDWAEFITRQQFLKNFASAREAGFDNINVDL